ncbi:MAG: VWA domain-containing protein [Desulfobacteraceae bacterium]|nr:VWA domain-containing protein [Desulfobacteraceae bacterium]
MIGFVNIWSLAGLLAVSLPVVIHFMTRPRPRRILYPTYRFLVEAAGGRQALYRLRTLIVLTLRCLAVLMLVLLFSKPFLQQRSSASQAELSKKAAIIIDASLSMKGIQGGVTLFDKAKAEAAELMRTFEADTAAAVIFIKAKPEPVLPALSANIPALHKRLQASKASSALGTPSSAIALAEQMLNGPGVIYIFSDFQRTNWNNIVFDSKTDLSVILRPVTEEPIDNIAVTGIQINPPSPVAGEPVEIGCTIFNCTGKDRQEPVSLIFLGERFSKIVNLKPFSPTHAVFSVIARDPGEFEGKIRLGQKDGLNDDNERFFKIKIIRESFVLIISDENPDDLSGSAFFVRTAAEPDSEKESGVKGVLRHSQDTDIKVLDQADTYIICSPAVISEKVAAAITSRVLEGSTLICFLDGPKAPGIVEALSTASQDQIAPPFQLLTQVRSIKQDGDPLTDINYSQDPLKLFANQNQGDLSLLGFTRHYKTGITLSRKHEILMSYSDGSAAFAVSPAGRGTVIYINFPATPDGGNLVQSPLFPALLHECLRLGNSNTAESETRPGQAWEILVPNIGANDETGVSVHGPDGRKVEFYEVSLGSHIKLTLPQADMPGIYHVYKKEKTVSLGVVNTNPRESDTRQIAVQEMVRSDQIGQGTKVVTYTPDQLKTNRKKDMWPLAWLLFAVFLGFEMLVLSIWRKG